MRITSKGQVTIPQEIREQFGLLPDTEVEFTVVGNSIRLVKASDKSEGRRGARLVSRLRGTSTVGMTTEEILKLTRG
ncbi:MAG TPA: AbrB/MazE/SpoVT family DNA-binding domain-containing protein [Polyangiaceae bacterium]|nr:AbrB/MazE/SpoVT family DNA-binding domain-containing protein [Polyangiaceae bacterium]